MGKKMGLNNAIDFERCRLKLKEKKKLSQERLI
jgi:hypothetical protein